MKGNTISLSPAEWKLMECLWERSPRTAREVIDDLKARVGWTRSTTLTMLRRMSEKGLIQCTEDDGPKTYSTKIRRNEAALQETQEFLDRVYNGSIRLMMSAITEQTNLSRTEIDELYEILRKAEEQTK